MSRILKGGSDDVVEMRVQQKPSVGEPQGLKQRQFRSVHASNLIAFDEAEKNKARAVTEAKSQAMQEAEKKLKAPLLASVENLENILDELSKFRRELFKESENEVVELVRRVSKKIILHELSIQPEKLHEIIVESLKILEDEKKIIVLMNPKDIQSFQSAKQDFLSQFSNRTEIQVHGEAKIPSGQAIVETQTQEVRLQVEEMVDQLLGETLEKKSEAEEPGDEGDKV